MTTNMGQDKCPICDYKIDSAEGLDDSKAIPNPGDITMCLKCTSLLVFAEDMALIEAPEELIASLPLEVQIELHELQLVAKEVGKGYWDKKENV